MAFRPESIDNQNFLNEKYFTTSEYNIQYSENIKRFVKICKKYLKEKNYSYADYLLKNLTAIIFNDKDLFQMSFWDVFELCCCHFYCTVWMNSTYVDLAYLPVLKTRVPLFHYLKAVVCFLERKYKRALFHINMAYILLKNDDCFYSTEVLNEDVIPELNKKVLRERLKILQIICCCEIKNKRTSINSKQQLIIGSKFGMENAFNLVPCDFCTKCSYYHINVLHYDGALTENKILVKQEQISALESTKAAQISSDIETETCKTPLEPIAAQTGDKKDYVRENLGSVRDLHLNMKDMKLFEKKFIELSNSIGIKLNIITDNFEKQANDDYNQIADLTKQLKTVEKKLNEESTENDKLRITAKNQADKRHEAEIKINKLNNSIIDIENKQKSIIDNLMKEAQDYETKITNLTTQLNTAEEKLSKDNSNRTSQELTVDVYKAHHQEDTLNPSEDDLCISSPIKSSYNSDSEFELLSQCTSPSYVQHSSNKTLLEYLETNLHDEDFTVLNILSKICEENSGNLTGLERGKLVDDIRKRLKSESD